jgi:hypothetical protein
MLLAARRLALLRQCLYFCTSKASKLSTVQKCATSTALSLLALLVCRSLARRLALLRQCLYLCTSKASPPPSVYLLYWYAGHLRYWYKRILTPKALLAPRRLNASSAPPLPPHTPHTHTPAPRHSLPPSVTRASSPYSCASGIQNERGSGGEG